MISQPSDPAHAEGGKRTDARRNFLYLATGTFAAFGTTAVVWPLIDNMNPSADVLALASVDVDLAPIPAGQRITVKWQGKPLFVTHRTSEEITLAKSDDEADLPDPEPDDVRAPRREWLIVVGICTHLGCIPLGQKPTDARGGWRGWFCPCHGSHYDTSGRIRKGPAPKNLVVPPYDFVEETLVHVG